MPNARDDDRVSALARHPDPDLWAGPSTAEFEKCHPCLPAPRVAAQESDCVRHAGEGLTASIHGIRAFNNNDTGSVNTDIDLPQKLCRKIPSRANINVS